MSLSNIHYKERDKLAADLVRAAIEAAHSLGSDVLVSSGPEAKGTALRRMHLNGVPADYLQHGKPDLPRALADLGKLSAMVFDAAHKMGAGQTLVKLDDLLYMLGKMEGNAPSVAARVVS